MYNKNSLYSKHVLMFTCLSLSLTLSLSSSRNKGLLLRKLEKKQIDHYFKSYYKDKIKNYYNIAKRNKFIW